MSLYSVLRDKEYDVRYLLTSVNKEYQRVSMHGVRLALLRAQAENIGITLRLLELPLEYDMEFYDAMMKTMLGEYREEGITCSIFGDIFLEDLRQYREDQLAKVNMKGIFPIWKIPTTRLADDFINAGFKSVIVCVDERYLDQSFSGREFDRQFLADLPANVDPCGENGEFHTFVYDGPIFKQPVIFKHGETVYRKYESAHNTIQTGFWYRDLIPS